ncbi:MAG: ABC transporter substrate-binding protein [Sedimentisphaerales bacterium]|nr:ABC transporter substrate-binding protein [Sedimentisphaerales bacterium]MBN2842064.1 ABC transporter substrate-binding protein [Sedimentisphaerales bacterium]
MRKMCILLLALLLVISIADAENGITETEIILGQSCALNGPASALGKGMKSGLLTAFMQVNDAGGVNGRQVKLISLDDGYEPEKAVNNTQIFIKNEKVFMLIGEVGTPTANAVVPLAVESGVPFFGAFTGAESLRSPYNHLIVNLRASYNQEMEKLAEYLVDKQGLTRISCFYQDDGYGLAGLSGIKQALKKRGLELISEGNYKRNTLAVKRGLLTIRKSGPQAVVMVGAYRPCAEFIKLARSLNMGDVVFCNISFVGTAALQEELAGQGAGCIISQVMPLPGEASLAIVSEYKESLAKYQPGESADFVSLEGYVAGRLFCELAGKVEGELTRESFLAVVKATTELDLGGMKISYGPEDNQGSDAVFLTELTEDGIRQLQ